MHGKRRMDRMSKVNTWLRATLGLRVVREGRSMIATLDSYLRNKVLGVMRLMMVSSQPDWQE
jgi:hypothetical protein